MRLYNTMSGQVEDFTPRGQNIPVTIYACGITPYDVSHLGHALAGRSGRERAACLMPPARNARYLGVDTGGTFTDLVEIDGAGRLRFEKAFGFMPG